MLKIGEFAKEADVAVKTLRHYAKLGLLKPAWIDRFTGYRYYAQEQIPRLNRIMALKDLGFTLEQTGRILQNELTVAELRGMLRLKCAELEQRIEEDQERLTRVETRLDQIENEGDFLLSLITQHKERLTMEPEIITKPAFTAVGLNYYGKNENGEILQVWHKLNPRFGEIQNKTGVAYGVCDDMDDNGRLHYLAGFGVTTVDNLPEGMDKREVPEQQYAVFPCSLKTIHETYRYIFETWLPQSGYGRSDGPDFEFYGEKFYMDTGEGMAIYMPVKRL
ncbi:MAG: MerR family transcriptional regulator [Chloroflexi bacterium]|nr:MerR family transcriptional regulator [Chloroflexota bacterium]